MKVIMKKQTNKNAEKIEKNVQKTLPSMDILKDKNFLYMEHFFREFRQSFYEHVFDKRFHHKIIPVSHPDQIVTVNKQKKKVSLNSLNLVTFEVDEYMEAVESPEKRLRYDKDEFFHIRPFAQHLVARSIKNIEKEVSRCAFLLAKDVSQKEFEKTKLDSRGEVISAIGIGDVKYQHKQVNIYFYSMGMAFVPDSENYIPKIAVIASAEVFMKDYSKFVRYRHAKDTPFEDRNIIPEDEPKIITADHEKFSKYLQKITDKPETMDIGERLKKRLAEKSLANGSSEVSITFGENGSEKFLEICSGNSRIKLGQNDVQKLWKYQMMFS